jgi:hypothetical protein
LSPIRDVASVVENASAAYSGTTAAPHEYFDQTTTAQPEPLRELNNMLPEQPAQHVGKGRPGPGRGNKTGDTITRLSERGTSRTYRLTHLKRDRPDLAQRVIAGDLSANAAAIAAEFRSRTTGLE